MPTDNRGKIINSFYEGAISGFGDFLRGSIHLYKRCKSHGLDFHIDLRHHPISEFVNSKYDTDYSKKEIRCLPTEIHKESIIDSHDRMNSAIFNLLKNTKLGQKNYVFSNFDYFTSVNPKFLISEINKMEPLEEDISNWFKDSLCFSDKINREVDLELVNAGLEEKKFNIIHFRLGDENSFHNDADSEFEVPTNSFCFDVCVKTLEEDKTPLVLLSDSNDLKEYIKKKSIKYNLPIHVFHLQSNHMQKKTNLQKELDEIKYTKKNLFYTVFDMKLMTVANSVRSYSVYPWGSGFITWICKIYKTPISLNWLKSS